VQFLGLLIISLGLYLFSLFVALVFQYIFRKYKGKRVLIPYDRFPIAIALALLTIAAGMLVAGNEKLANDIAIMAYYLLALGVVLQIINYIREQRAERRAKEPGGKDSENRDKSEDHTAEGE